MVLIVLTLIVLGTDGIDITDIDSIETDVDKEQVKTFMRTLYTEAVNVEV